MKQKQIKINRFIYFLFLASVLISLTSCSAQKNKEINTITIELLTDSILNPYTYFSEIKITPTNNILLKNIQSLSENKNINSINPKERLQEKIELSNLCKKVSIPDCNYTPEGYKILTNNKDILNIEYGYNMFSNPDEYFKYAVFNLENGRRIAYEQMFNNAKTILKMFDDKYVSGIKNYVADLNQDDEEEFHEYGLYKEHLEIRIPFKLEDLNNFEIVYDSTQTKATELKFHYNGQGGVYRRLFPPDYIAFNIEELKPLLTEYFKKQLGI